MTFFEVYPAIKEGRGIRRKGWIATVYKFNNDGYLTNYLFGKQLPVLLTKQDLDAIDWEIAEKKDYR